jgi:hypothetical protein
MLVAVKLFWMSTPARSKISQRKARSKRGEDVRGPLAPHKLLPKPLVGPLSAACNTPKGLSGQDQVQVAELVPEVPVLERDPVGALAESETSCGLEQLEVRRLALVPAGEQAVDRE